MNDRLQNCLKVSCLVHNQGSCIVNIESKFCIRDWNGNFYALNNTNDIEKSVFWSYLGWLEYISRRWKRWGWKGIQVDASEGHPCILEAEQPYSEPFSLNCALEVEACVLTYRNIGRPQEWDTAHCCIGTACSIRVHHAK